MKKDKMKLVLDASKEENISINDEVIKIEKEENISPSYSIFSMVGDAVEMKAKIFKITKSIKQDEEIPEFTLIEYE